ncbi:MAG TPA: cyclase family protein [Burkholderiaceae bacterium]|nr:cyclase family protein [Burkholderiaceae bacterium]
MSRRWKQRPPGSNWGEFGPDDRLGRINLLTRQRRLAAASEVREGLAFCLSLPLEIGAGLNPSRHPPRLGPTVRNGRPRYHYCACDDVPGATDVVCDDVVTLYTQYSTQWDSLCHIGSLFDADGDGKDEVVYYNGYPASWGIGQSALGIQHMAAAAIQGRGVLIDLARHVGESRVSVTFEMLSRWMQEDGVRVEEGDMLCLHTGFAGHLLSAALRGDAAGHGAFGAVLDGTDARLLQWITDSGISALIADNVAIEQRVDQVRTGHAGPLMPLHEHCLFKLGLPIGEMWHLGPLAEWLAAHGRSRFQLTAPPLRLTGAVGSPVTPVATV